MNRLFGVLAALALLLAAPAASARGARGAWSWNSAGTARGGQWQGFSPSWSPSSVLWLRGDSGVTVVAGHVTATGTSPPTVTLSGTPTATQISSATPYVELDCTTGGAVGTSLYTLKLNGATVATGIASASSGVSIPGSGLTAGWAVGNSTNNDVYTSNVTASGWADQSGLGHNATQATSANQLTYVTSGGANGQPYLQSTFNGPNSTFLTGASPLVTTQPVEYFVVARTNVTSPPGAYPYLFNVAGTLNECGTLQETNTHNIEQDNGVQANAITMTVNADFVVDSYFNGASSTLALNGGAPVGPANAGANGSFSGGYLISAAAPANSWGGFIYEIVVVNRQIAVGDLTRMLYYFNARYNGL